MTEQFNEKKYLLAKAVSMFEGMIADVDDGETEESIIEKNKAQILELQEEFKDKGLTEGDVNKELARTLLITLDEK